MINCPLENTAEYTTDWIQLRAVVTQQFGETDFAISSGAYKPMKGHNGIDLRAKSGTPIFSPCSGSIIYKESTTGYGNHVKIRSYDGCYEIVLGHMSKFAEKRGEIKIGDLVGYSGNTGYSTAPHLHIGLRHLVREEKSIWKWLVKDYDNGYLGYIDILPYMITWKGTMTKNTLS